MPQPTTSSTAPAATPSRGRVRADRVVWWITACFAVNGAAMASAVARIPALRDQTHASATALGLALLGTGVGSLLAMPLTPRLVGRFGSGWVVRGAAALALGAWVVAGAAHSVVLLGASLLFAGAAVGTWDVAMNVAGHHAEQRDGRSWMPMLHAAFSAGAVLGAGIAAVAVHLDAAPVVQLAIVGAVLMALVVPATAAFPPDQPDQPDHDEDPTTAEPGRSEARTAAARRTSPWRNPVLLTIGLVTLATALGEGAANDWLALTLVDTRHATQTAAAVAYAGFNVAMVTGRLAGGAAIDRVGRAPVVRTCAATAAVGVLLVCLTPGLALGLLGTVCWGLGLSVIFPATMSAAGEVLPGRGADGIAVASTIGYGGFLLGPPTLGFLADHVGLDRALLVVAALAAAAAVLAGATRDRSTSA